jgi:hypothetical protein
MPPDERPPVELGTAALEFVREELRTAATGFGGPLASRLVVLELGFPLALLTRDMARAAHDLQSGGVDDGNSDRRLAIAVSGWLGDPDPGHRRLLVLEDPLARHTDAGIDPRSMHFGDRVYHSAHQGDGPDQVWHAFKELAGYPGVGVLTRPAADTVASGALADDTLDAMADAAVAVLVRAWDDEAFLVVPVAAAFGPSDLGGR